MTNMRELMPAKTFAHRCLDIEAEAFPIDRGLYSLLDKILKSAIDIDTQRNPGEVLFDIEQLLLKDFSFKVQLRSPSLGIALDTRIINCETSSILTYSIGEVLELPFYFAQSPNHIFIKARIRKEREEGVDREDREDGKIISYHNFDMAWRGSRDDLSYALESSIHPKSVEEGVYLTILDETQNNSIPYAIRGFRRWISGSLNAAIMDFKTALHYHPKCTIAMNGIAEVQIELADELGITQDGNIQRRNQLYAHALQLFNKIIELDPYDIFRLLDRAKLKEKIDDIDGAREDIEFIHHNKDRAIYFKNSGLPYKGFLDELLEMKKRLNV
ncbi:MAG: hypothetical protein ABIG89_01935 [Candidatus Woesearchaeota archaeon]